MKILDTDHCIGILRGHANPDRHILPNETLAVTSISVAELTFGAHKSSRPAENLTRLDILLSQVQILPFDEDAARQFGWLKAQLQRLGQTIADADLQIASIALTVQAPLLTHNHAHFARLTALCKLELEDWLS